MRRLRGRGPALRPGPGLTLARAHGYWKRCTLQKSSATATTRSLWERQRELMSVPSEPSGHTPDSTAAAQPGLLPAAAHSPEPPAPGAPPAGPPTGHVPGNPARGAPGPPGRVCWLLDTHPWTPPSIPGPGQAPQPCAPAHRTRGSLARRCRWPTPGLGCHNDSSPACSLQPRSLGRGRPPSSALTRPSAGKRPGRPGWKG